MELYLSNKLLMMLYIEDIDVLASIIVSLKDYKIGERTLLEKSELETKFFSSLKLINSITKQIRDGIRDGSMFVANFGVAKMLETEFFSSLKLINAVTKQIRDGIRDGSVFVANFGATKMLETENMYPSLI